MSLRERVTSDKKLFSAINDFNLMRKIFFGKDIRMIQVIELYFLSEKNISFRGICKKLSNFYTGRPITPERSRQLLVEGLDIIRKYINERH